MIEYFDQLLLEAPDERSAYPFQPVSLLLLDIVMPIKDGLQTLDEVKNLFKKHNARL